ncbi:MAG TPA: antibiotic biosynthesis monooxygenase [Candidatus Hydrogenedentes bacterium]|nr:antibiotic biosynthesis monooxygenase [Candidatus Hydrogenedentota bacterium]
MSDTHNHDEPKSAALIITHTVKAGTHRTYEAWLGEILAEVSKSPGYLGREIFRPAHGKRKYTSIVHFETEQNVREWIASEARNAFIGRVHPLLEGGDIHEIRTGLDYWFTPEGVKPPKRWKQFLLTLSAVYPLSLLIPRAYAPLFDAFPLANTALLKGLIIAATLTALLTFAVMPHYTRLMSHWLFDDKD